MTKDVSRSKKKKIWEKDQRFFAVVLSQMDISSVDIRENCTVTFV